MFFANTDADTAREMKKFLDELAMQYNGDIQFAYVDKHDEELLSLTLWVYKAPWFYFFIDGMAYSIPIEPIYKKNIGELRDIIDKKEYLTSMLRMKAPARIKEWTLPWHYVVKDARAFYVNSSILNKVESVLRRLKIWYLVDKNPLDQDNVIMY